jgi:EAL and modified HD-GYP domain-containing signal transduction protein
MTNPASPAPLDRVFLGRQPILDASQALIGYELLFRDSAENQAPAAEPGVASADVVCKAFTELGLAGALGGHKAFIIADAEFLHAEVIELLPPDSVVFEIDAALAADAGVLARAQALSQSGYSLCVNNLAELDEAVLPLLKQAMFVKINLKALPDERLRPLLDLPADFRPLAIASHVETRADHERARALGFQFFQGYYFAEPTLVEGKKLDPAAQGLIRIVNLLNRDAELGEVEQAFKSEAALTLKLLRLTNSVGVGLRVRIASVRQAVNIIGRRQIQRWLQLLLFSRNGDSGDIEHNPLMQLSALKGAFMERLAQRCYPNQSNLPEVAFLAGLMSLMPAAFGVPMGEILEQISMVPELRFALLTREGELGQLLELTDRYDGDDPAGVDAVLQQLGYRITRETLNQCLVDSIAWVQSLAVEAE